MGEYRSLPAVEELIEHMLKLVPQQVFEYEINKALDEKNEEMFKNVLEKYSE